MHTLSYWKVNNDWSILGLHKGSRLQWSRNSNFLRDCDLIYFFKLDLSLSSKLRFNLIGIRAKFNISNG